MQTTIEKTALLIGQPDLLDPIGGGIAIWGHMKLSRTKYKFLQRVEIIDENVPCVFPVPHVSNTYIWIRIDMSQYQTRYIVSLSPNFMYDRKKKTLIVRSSDLHKAIALAAIVKLYSIGKLSMNQIVNYQLCKKYFVSAKKTKFSRSVRYILRS